MTLRPNPMIQRVISSLVLLCGHFGGSLSDAGWSIHLSQEPPAIPPAPLTPSSAGHLKQAGNCPLQAALSSLQQGTPSADPGTAFNSPKHSEEQSDCLIKFYWRLGVDTITTQRNTYMLIKVVTLEVHSSKSQPQALSRALSWLEHDWASSASSQLTSRVFPTPESSSRSTAPDFSARSADFHPKMTGKGVFPFLQVETQTTHQLQRSLHGPKYQSQ